MEGAVQCLAKCLPAPPPPPEVGSKAGAHRSSNKEATGQSREASGRSRLRDTSETSVCVVPAYGGLSRLTKQRYDSIVSAPTPPERWFAPRTGWPAHVDFAGGTPSNLMPTAAEQPDFFLPESAALGTLRVEVLETDGLPRMDILLEGENDVYAMLLFEDNVAATRPISDVERSARARM